MRTRGAARTTTNHDHDARDAVPVRGRWVVKCACGHASIGLTLSSACQAHRAHAEFLAQLAAGG